MDGHTFTELATVITKLKMYPYFDIANYLLMSLMVREDNHPPATGILLKFMQTIRVLMRLVYWETGSLGV